MRVRDIIAKFESRDPHAIRKATWVILRSNDRDAFEELREHVPRLRAILASVDMGGMVRKNADDTELAFRYVEDTCRGVCRCRLYEGQNFFNPETEAGYGFVHVLKSEVMRDLHEQHFLVQCDGCSRMLKVREVHGWHVPWYEWMDA